MDEMSWGDAKRKLTLTARDLEVQGYVRLPPAIRSALARVEELESRLAAADGMERTALAYDALIYKCANDPSTMSSACTAQGDDLDSLYAAWIGAVRAYAASKGEM